MRGPRQLARRLAQIGIVDAADGGRLQGLLKTGQRLVSTKGALWRWDGFTASADAPTAAAQRLAQKNRLAELDAEMAAATQKVRTAEAALAAAESTVRERVAGEAAARQAWRDGQRALGEARDALARAEKAAGELSGRRDVSESRTRINDDLVEATAAVTDAEARLAGAPDLGDLRDRLEALAATVTRDRGVLAMRAPSMRG